MPNDKGVKVRKFYELTDMGVSYFEHIFKESNRANTAEIVKITSYFPRLV
jgi:DNA-binding PadR family transcriptional regulator